MATEQVRMWRNADEDRVLLMAGQTAHYAIEPRGEYVFGIVTGQPMRSRRGRERRVVLPGQLVAWDPSGAHAGTAVDARPWTARLMVVEVAGLAELTGDGEVSVLADAAFPEPVISDPRLAADFLDLGPFARTEQFQRKDGFQLHGRHLCRWEGRLLHRFILVETESQSNRTRPGAGVKDFLSRTRWDCEKGGVGGWGGI